MSISSGPSSPSGRDVQSSGRGDPVAFFDIGDTLASVRVDPAGRVIEELVPLPGVIDVLTGLQAAGVRMGVISDRGTIPEAEVTAALARAGLDGFFDRRLVLFGRKDSVRVFERAADLARSSGAPSSDPTVVFTGEDAVERTFARAADFLVSPHVTLTPGILSKGHPLRFLRVRVPPALQPTDWRALLRDQAVVPLHVVGGAAPELYAVADTVTALRLDDLGFWVDRWGRDDEPLSAELYLLRDDGGAGGTADRADGFATAFFAGHRAAGRVLASTAGGLVIALPAGRSVESVHFPTARHGHNLKLTAQPSLLAARAGPEALISPAVIPAGAALDVDEIEVLGEEITASRIQEAVERYSGSRPVAEGTTLVSRHIRHPDNARAVDALLTDLGALGGDRLVVRTHRFRHAGHRYSNVEAVLAARGMPGTVLLTAHLDSTAARQGGYQPELDPAAGADDDASGMAAVLTAARAVLALDALAEGERREFRFVLFNAEEQGLVGSRAYARGQAAQGADIVAVLQLDMMGFNAVAPGTFELHAGFTPDPTVQERSLTLAGLVGDQVGQVAGELPTPQVYPAGDGLGDPAEERSDHYSFQLNGYTACLATEDFFAGPGPATPDANPDYHLPTDRTVDAAYAAAITRAMTAAAWLCGTR